MLDRARLEAIVRRAGEIAMAQWPVDNKALEVHGKMDGTPVSAADLAVDAFLRAELTGLLPCAGWLSEETIDAPNQRAGELVWLVDPIDGTRDFIHGRTGWAISVALVSNGRPLLAMLHAPARDEFWQAEAGQGAFCNGARLAASSRGELAGARVPTRMLPAEDADLEMVDQPNSIALRIAMVAADRADLVATLRWGYEWDLAAAALIAREAGAAISDACGGKLNYNKPDPRVFGVAVSAPAIHADLIARLAARAQQFGQRPYPAKPRSI